MKSYCWDNKGKEETEKQEFIKKYAEWIEEPQGTCPYSDPDGVNENNVKNIGFYTNITSFLNNRCKEFTDKSRLEVENIEFLPPTGIKKDEPEPKNRTIVVEGHNLYLTSDQFGFSANKDIYDNKNDRLKNQYPFVKYVKNYGGSDSLVGDTIWYTRTIGGSFLWPKVDQNGWRSLYNTNRGVRSYIEDRVDLTLYEIKEYLDYRNIINQGSEKEEHKNNLLYNTIEKANIKEASACKDCNNECDRCHKVEGNDLKKWLSIFKNFKTYVDFFCFDDFVNKEDDEYYPKDIFTGKSITKDNISEYREKGKSKYKFIQNKATKNDLEKAFYNLIFWTIARSARMETIISNNDKKNQTK